MPVLNPEHLFDQADQLATSTGAGALRQADLRRAVSAAYYGVFHAILTAAADLFVGSTHRDTLRYELVYRSISHTSLSRACEEVAKPLPSKKYAKYQPRGGFGPDLQAAAAAVIDLQNKRHAADCDPLHREKLSDVQTAIRTAREARVRLNGATPEKRNAFLSLVVFTPR